MSVAPNTSVVPDVSVAPNISIVPNVSVAPNISVVPNVSFVPDLQGSNALPVDPTPISAALKESPHHSLPTPSNGSLEPSPPEVAPEHEHQSLSSPTSVAEAESQLILASTPENEDQAAISPGPPSPSQKPSSNDAPPTPPITDDTVATIIHSQHSEIIPVPPRLFAFGGTSSFLTSSVINYWETIKGGQTWIDMVKTYLRLEELPLPRGVRNLNLPSLIVY